MRHRSALIMALAAVVMQFAVSGCVSPIEVKQASKAQLDLIAALDSATSDLQQSLGQFQHSLEARTREEGRIWIAKQAIAVAYPETSTNEVTSDDLFKGHTEAVQPWIDYAFLSQDIDDTIKRLEDRLQKAKDPALKIQLTNEIQTWKLRQARLANKPKAVEEIEAVIVDDLNGQAQTASTVDKTIEILRAQIALMKQMAVRIDAWLAIDVTVTQDQADALRQAVSSAAGSLGGGK
jgi:outer membrane murein-binding lipoprotein Lpp